MNTRCFLVIEDGSVYPGYSFGSPPPRSSELSELGESLRAVGELVFNTGMTGYPEILTDPSYTGQIVAMTYPHAGNYGIDPAWSETGPGITLGAVQPAGFVVRSLYRGPTPRGRTSLDRYLHDNGVPGITDVDTRSLTIAIRTSGSPRALIVAAEGSGMLSESERDRCTAMLKGFPQMEGRGLVHEVGCRVPAAEKGTTGPVITLIDTGIKANIIRSFRARGCTVNVLPSDSTASAILETRPDGVLFSNGPGDPAVLTPIVREIGKLVGKIPLFGICLGHQLISLALGAGTYKMAFGHHGCNHPVRDEFSGRVYVTSQNHGFAVAEESLPAGTSVWLRNANDGTIEGLSHADLPIRTVQFHPEAAPGPLDTNPIFDEFLSVAGTASTER